jgi:hypothetical protein
MSRRQRIRNLVVHTLAKTRTVSMSGVQVRVRSGCRMQPQAL